MVKLPSDNNFSLRGDTLQAALDKDKAAGLIPFFVSLTEKNVSKADISIHVCRQAVYDRADRFREKHE